MIPSDGANSDFFGYAVSISGDTILVGAFADDDKGKDSGSAYVFVRSGSTWSQQAKLTAADGKTEDRFGWSLCIEGDTALIGAPDDDGVDASGVDNRIFNSGSGYVFIRSGSTWSFQQKLAAAGGVPSGQAGKSVALSGDTAILGAPNSTVQTWSTDGSVFIFTRNGTIWSQQQRLLSPDPIASAHFGSSVSILDDTALIGSMGLDDKGESSGAAYIYVRSGNTWTQKQKLLAYDGSQYAYFGCAVSLSENMALVGARGDSFSRGSAYLFWHIGDTWSQQRKLTASDAANSDYFGYSVCLSGDTALIGAYGDDRLNYQGNTADNGGSAYIFRISEPDISADSDGDGLPDAFETGTGTYFSPDDTGTDPHNPDSDGDGLSDGDEVNIHGTSPTDWDSDDDGYFDKAEVDAGSDPLNAAVTPDPTGFTAIDGFSLSVVSRLGSTYRVVGFTDLQSGAGEVVHDNIPGTGRRIYPFVDRAQGQDKKFWQFFETNP